MANAASLHMLNRNRIELTGCSGGKRVDSESMSFDIESCAAASWSTECLYRMTKVSNGFSLLMVQHQKH